MDNLRLIIDETIDDYHGEGLKKKLNKYNKTGFLINTDINKKLYGGAKKRKRTKEQILKERAEEKKRREEYKKLTLEERFEKIGQDITDEYIKSKPQRKQNELERNLRQEAYNIDKDMTQDELYNFLQSKGIKKPKGLKPIPIMDIRFVIKKKIKCITGYKSKFKKDLEKFKLLIETKAQDNIKLKSVKTREGVIKKIDEFNEKYCVKNLNKMDRPTLKKIAKKFNIVIDDSIRGKAPRSTTGNPLKPLQSLTGVKTFYTDKQQQEFIKSQKFKKNPFEITVKDIYKKKADEPLTLTPKQKKFIEKMIYSNNRGGIAFWGVGTGKTVLTVLSIKLYLQYFPFSKVVFIAPSALLANLVQKLYEFGLDIRDNRIEYFSLDKFSRSSGKRDGICQNALLIIDEAHNLRTEIGEKKGKDKEGNPISRGVGGRAKAIIDKCSPFVAKVLLLTATPFVNTPYDIENLLAMIDGRNQLDRKNFDNITSNKETSADYFKLRVSFFQRLFDNSDFPKKIDKPPLLAIMNEEEERKMDLILNSDDPAVKAYYGEARQGSNTIGQGKKLKKVIETIENSPNSQNIIYVAFVDNGLNKLVDMMILKDMSYAVVSGAEGALEKQKSVSDYNTGIVNNMIITKAGAEGLDLKNTTNLFVVDMPWNEATREQVIGRGIRYKSHISLPPNKRFVNVYNVFLIKKSEQKYIDKISKIKDDKQFNLILTQFRIDQAETKKKDKSQGSGLIEGKKDFSKKIKKILNKYGNNRIVELKIGRRPLSNYINKALNLLSLGKWEKLRNEFYTDKLFHIFLVIELDNGKILSFEKNDIVNLDFDERCNLKNVDCLDIEDYEGNLRLEELIKIPLDEMGKNRYFPYDPFKLNCGIFIEDILRTFDLYNNEIRDFSKQDLNEIILRLPNYVKKVARMITDFTAFTKRGGAEEFVFISDEDRAKAKEKGISNQELYKKSFNKHSAGLVRQDLQMPMGITIDILLFVMSKSKQYVINSFEKWLKTIPHFEDGISKLENKIMDKLEKLKNPTEEDKYEIYEEEMKTIIKKGDKIITEGNIFNSRVLSVLEKSTIDTTKKAEKYVNKKFQEYFTQDKEIEKLYNLSGLKNDDRQDIKFLEGTAGNGNIIQYIKKRHLVMDFRATEYREDNRKLLKKYIKSVGMDIDEVLYKENNFLNLQTSDTFEYCFLNPPFNLDPSIEKIFTRRVYDIDFIKKAYTLLKKGGVLCAILYQPHTNEKVKDKILKENAIWLKKHSEKIINENALFEEWLSKKNKKIPISIVKIVKKNDDEDNDLITELNRLNKEQPKEFPKWNKKGEIVKFDLETTEDLPPPPDFLLDE